MKVFLHPAAIEGYREVEKATGLVACVAGGCVELRPRSIFREPDPARPRAAPPSRIDAIIAMAPEDLDRKLE